MLISTASRRGLRRPDRPGRLLRLQGRHRRHDAADRARPGAQRHPQHDDRARHLRHADAVRHAAGSAGRAGRERALPFAASARRRTTPSWCTTSSTNDMLNGEVIRLDGAIRLAPKCSGSRQRNGHGEPERGTAPSPTAAPPLRYKGGTPTGALMDPNGSSPLPYAAILQTYMAALGDSDYVTIKDLFSRRGKVLLAVPRRDGRRARSSTAWPAPRAAERRHPDRHLRQRLRAAPGDGVFPVRLDGARRHADHVQGDGPVRVRPRRPQGGHARPDLRHAPDPHQRRQQVRS